jgi:hypothetical protein
MNPATKLALRRFALRWLRKLVDVADDRLHAAEVTLRNDLAGTQAPAQRANRADVLRAVAPTRDSATHTSGYALEPASTGEGSVIGVADGTVHADTQVHHNSFYQWEARRSGLTPKVKTHRRRRARSSAADFDFQIIRKREEFVQ